MTGEEPRRLEVETELQVITPERRPPTTRSLGTWWLVVAALLGSLGVLALGHLRLAMIALAASLWLGAAVRAVLPEEAAGGLVVRSRVFDAAVLLVLGGAVLTVGLALRRT